MVATPLIPLQSTVTYLLPQSIADFMANPIDDAEWVDEAIIQKNGMTLKHGAVQAAIAYYWRSHAELTQQGGSVFTEAPCRTRKQVRRPDVAYLTPERLVQTGQLATLPSSFSLIAEISSPTDYAEELFAKAEEYLQSGCEEVWLVFPENRWVLVLTRSQHLWFTVDETATTQATLPGFSVSVQELLG
jgi:Uma2 family endonuclease